MRIHVNGSPVEFFRFCILRMRDHWPNMQVVDDTLAPMVVSRSTTSMRAYLNADAAETRRLFGHETHFVSINIEGGHAHFSSYGAGQDLMRQMSQHLAHQRVSERLKAV